VREVKVLVAIGIDIDTDAEKVRARMVLLSSDLEYPYVLDHRCFRSLRQFQRYWTDDNCMVSYRAAGCSVSASSGEDPLGILAWLSDQKVSVDRSLLERYDIEQEFLMRGLPETYRWAFAHAFREVYRIRGPVCIEQLWVQLLALRQQLGAITRELGHYIRAQ
jgi:hypothetical protein